MQAASAAFGALIEGNDMVVEHQVTVRLPIYRTNLCPNPNFEYGTLGWSGSAGATFATSRAQRQTADQSLLVTWPTAVAQNPFVSIQVPVKPGTVYTASAYVFVPTGQPAVQLIVDGLLSAASTITNAWQRLTLTYTATDASTLVGVINNVATTAGQQVYLDAVMVEEAPAAGTYFDGDSLPDLNICGNPSFEQPLLPEWWVPVSCNAQQDNTWQTDGDYSCALIPNGLTPGYLAAGGDYAAGVMRTGLVAGNTYTVSADINVPVALTGGAASLACRIVIGWDVGAGLVVGAFSPQGPTGGGSQRLAVTATIPANATAAVVWLYNGYTNTAANIVQWDAVLIRRATSDTAFFGGQRAGANAWLGQRGNSVSQLNVDPYPDATVAVESVSVQREIVTDMPDGTRLISGYPSATATVVLSGNMDPTDDSVTAASVFAPYDPSSPVYHGDAIDSDVIIQHGLYAGHGAELLTTFTGGVDEVVVDSEADQVTLTCLDARNQLRPTVTLPSFSYLSAVSNESPALTGDYVLEYLLRQNGIYTGPPPRSSCLFYASMHGSAWPELMGTYASQLVISVNTTADVLTDPVTNAVGGSPEDFMSYMVPGVWGPQVVRSPSVLNCPIAGSASLGSAGVVYFEGWVYLSADMQTFGSVAEWGISSDGSVGSTFARMAFQWTWNPGDATAAAGLGLSRVAGSTASNKAVAGATLTTAAWHHVGVQVKFTGSTTATVTSWIDGAAPVVNNITGLPAAGSEPTVRFGFFDINGYADTVQITSEASPTPITAFYPTAYLDPSQNALVAIADTSGQDPWGVIQGLAEAEGSISGLDEHGIFRKRNRAHLLDAAPARTVTSDMSLKSLQTDVGKSTLANHVTANVNALQLTQQIAVWSASDVIMVPAKGTYSTLVSTDAITLSPQAPDFGYGVVPAIPGDTYWRACMTKTGGTLITTGIKVTTRSVSATTLALTITNSNTFPIYMVSDTGHTDVSAGTPFVFIGGQQAVQPGTGVVADSKWQPSIDARGEVALQLPDNVWRQTATSSQEFTDDTVADLYRPRPIITNFTVVADPRLTLGERISVVDPDGSKMSDDVVLSGITLADSASDWTQSLDARGISNPGDWIMGEPGRSELGETTYT